MRARIASELKDELKRSWRLEIDPVVNLNMKEFLRNNGGKMEFIYS